MSPSANRWRPRRAGIINLYEYANQAFDFAGGRLLLRGHNTSGKTKALELLLPFCLDGDIRPTKLDPFASGAKDMKWNLVGCIDREQRDGYVWLEFERIDEGGASRRLTAGIGMHASRALPKVTRWYFVVRDRSVGGDLQLLRGGNPIGKAELAAALGDDGEVLDSPRDYRARLSDVLFGFGGEEQYQTMLRLMLDLRRPHLSKTLDPDGVAEQLSAGLPEIDDDLMRRLAGGLEQLETLERGLARLRDVRERVRRFHQRTYSAYVRAVVRERADELRRAQTTVESAAEQLRATRSTLESERGSAVRASAERDAAEAAVERLSAEERALTSSAAWSSVAEVEALRGQAASQRNAATAAREYADGTAASAGALEAELITARAAAADQQVQAESDLADALALAQRAGLAKRAGSLAAQLRDGTVAPEMWRGLLRDLASDWRDVLHRHRELLSAARRATAAAERARGAEREAADRVEQLAGRHADCEEQLKRALAAFTLAITSWREALTELSVDDDALAAALELGHAGRAPAPGFAPCVERARTAFADERSALLSARTLAADGLASTEKEIQRLIAEHDDGPLAPAWARSERAGRAGAPLWRLVDFAAHVTDGQRTALEAALEAAGLLDAWVTPSGGIEDPSLAEVLLADGPAASGETLAAALAPVAGQPVGEPVVARLLRRVGLGERTAGPWIDLDGRFALGPLSGRGAKAQAEHIGAAAREARRARRIAELRARAVELEAQIATHDAGLAAVQRRRATLDSEIAALPRADEVTASVDALRVASLMLAEAARVHEQAIAAARAAADAELEADGARREHAGSHGLPAGIDEHALDRLREASAELAGMVGAVARAWALAARQADGAAALAAKLSQTQALAADQDRRARDERAEADRLTAEHTAREQALGATGEEVRRRHAAVVSELRASRNLHRHAGDEAQAALVAAAALDRDAAAHSAEHELARTRREDCSRAFAQLALAGILQLALGDAAPEDVDRALAWTFTRTLEVVRALPEELLSVRSAAGALAVEVGRNVQLLDRELAEADMGAYASRGDDGLLLVRVTETGGEQTLAQVLERLDAEIADREQILTAEERRVFSDALVEEIADHLRQRMHEVRGRVERMNAVLQRSPTAAGKIVELEWQPLEDDAGTQRAALALLRRDVHHLGGESRGELVTFFRRRIEAARREHAFGFESRPMADTLMSAFDYRRWFAFGLHERSDAGRVRLTKRRHAVGSGGEQSVLIHLPLFAAAAALYGDSVAPRLVMLDEALSGIDDDTRERVLAATVAFDLDVVMTSHELWGTYRSVPQLAIYQLHRENGTFGVHAIPFIWDGDVLRELEQDELLV
ncbi:MAG: TIGR02680 family protein [Solirubrobacteraceae bacterium]